VGELAHVAIRSQVTVAHWRNNQGSDQCIDRRQCFRDTTSARAIGDIQFCSDFLMCQLDEAIAMYRLA